MSNINALLSTLSVAALLGCVATDADAGPYGDDLGKCLVNSTTSAEKRAMMKWMFATAALHPDVKPMAAVSTQQRDAFNKNVGTLFDRLITKTCRQQAQQAIKFEGESTIESSFQILGQVAARELFASPSVATAMTDMSRQIDPKKDAPVVDSTAGLRIVAAPIEPIRITP